MGHKIALFTVTMVLVLSAASVALADGRLPALSEKLHPSSLTQTGDTAHSEPVTLTDEQGQYTLASHMEILADPGGELTIEDVSSPAFDSQFIPSKEMGLSQGYTNTVYWVRFWVRNEVPDLERWLVEVDFANMFLVDLYYPASAEGQGFVEKQSGVMRPVSGRDLKYYRMVFNLPLEFQKDTPVYVRFQSDAFMYLGLTLWSPDQFMAHRLVEALLFGVFYGALLIMLFYNLFLHYTLSDLNYAYFSMFIGCALLSQAAYDGMIETYLWPAANVLKSLTLGWSLYGQMIFLLLFTISFFELRRRTSLLRSILFLLIALFFVFGILAPFVSFRRGAIVANYIFIIAYSLVLLTAFLSLIKGFQPARYFLLSCFGFFFSHTMIALSHLGVNIPFVMEQAARIGLVWLVAFWSLALADRIHLLKIETENANAALRNSEWRLSQILDSMPLGVQLYTLDYKAKYVNQGVMDIFGDAARGILPDLSAGRTLSQAISYFSLKIAGSQELYPVEKHPTYRALQGEPAWADDIEIERGNTRIPLEVHATPVTDDAGNIESAVVVIQDITQRKQVEAELSKYRKELELLVEQRTAQLHVNNQQLRRHLQWLAAINLVNQLMVSSADFREIYPMVIQIVNQLFAVPDSFIAEWDPLRHELKILGHSYVAGPGHELVGSYISVPEWLVELADLEHAGPVSISKDQLSSLSGPFGDHIRAVGVRSIIFIPLQVREKTIGLLGLEIGEDVRVITDEERELLSILSTDIAQLIEDEHLFEQSRILIATEERNRLARELHDSVAQTLYSISLFTDATRFALNSNKVDVAGAHLQELVQLSREAMSDMRLLIFELRPPILEKDGLVAALQSRLDAVEVRAGFQCMLHTEGELLFTSQQETELYRIVQEALNNVIKHAQATHVRIELISRDGSTCLTIVDDGIGFKPENAAESGGQGIRNIHERAEHIGASSSIVSAPGQGTAITIEVKNNETK